MVPVNHVVEVLDFNVVVTFGLGIILIKMEVQPLQVHQNELKGVYLGVIQAVTMALVEMVYERLQLILIMVVLID